MKTSYTINRSIDSVLKINFEMEERPESLEILARMEEPRLKDIVSVEFGGVVFDLRDYTTKAFSKILESLMAGNDGWQADTLQSVLVGGFYRESTDFDVCLSEELDNDEFNAEYEKAALAESLANCQAITTRETASI